MLLFLPWNYLGSLKDQCLMKMLLKRAKTRHLLSAKLLAQILSHSLTHSLRRHLRCLSRHAYFPCRSWFRLVFVRCPDITDQHRSWLVFQHLFYHAQASIALDPTLLAKMILDSNQQIGGVSSWSYHSLWEDPHKAVHWLYAPSNLS